MKTNTYDMDELLVKQLTGEATAAERTLVQQWLAADPSNQHYYEHFKLIWEESVHLSAAITVDENAAWDRFRHRVENNASKTKGRIVFMNTAWMRIAAIVVLVAGIAWLAQYLTNTTGTTIQTAQEVKTNTLPDGSSVTLNKHSEITYPARFAKKERVVNMKGEAFFNVSPDKSKPFIIHAGEVTVQVVGTSFNVRQQADSTEIIVETGIVRVSVNEQTITLQAGEKVMIHRNANTLQKQETTDRLYNYYRSRKFICDGTPLWRLVQTLNEAYDADIEIGNDRLRDLQLSTTFNNEPLENVLKIISETLEITVVKENGRYILR